MRWTWASAKETPWAWTLALPWVQRRFFLRSYRGQAEGESGYTPHAIFELVVQVAERNWPSPQIYCPSSFHSASSRLYLLQFSPTLRGVTQSLWHVTPSLKRDSGSPSDCCNP